MVEGMEVTMPRARGPLVSNSTDEGTSIWQQRLEQYWAIICSEDTPAFEANVALQKVMSVLPELIGEKARTNAWLDLKDFLMDDETGLKPEDRSPGVYHWFVRLAPTHQLRAQMLDYMKRAFSEDVMLFYQGRDLEIPWAQRLPREPATRSNVRNLRDRRSRR